MGSRTVVDIVKVVAPIALDALIASAQSLAEDSGLGAHNMEELAVSPSEQLFQNLSRAGSTLWANDFNYFYKGKGGYVPIGPNKFALVINAGSDLLIYDKTQGQMPDVNGYLQSLFKDTALSDPSAIELAGNINSIINDRWSEVSLDWQPLQKTYDSLTDNNGNTVAIDMLMYTACAQDQSGNTAGLAYYMFTFYKNPN